MTESQKLLAEYLENGSDSAFRELVARYVNLVDSTALSSPANDCARSLLTNNHFSFSLLSEMIATEITGFLQRLTGLHSEWFYQDTYWWTAFGLLGNLLFSSRFVIQWLYSERHKRVIVPPIFWHLSFWGSLVSLLYAFHLDKLPVILGYLFLPFLYARNLKLLRRGNSPAASGQTETSQPAAPPNAG